MGPPRLTIGAPHVVGFAGNGPFPANSVLPAPAAAAFVQEGHSGEVVGIVLLSVESSSRPRDASPDRAVGAMK